MLTATAAAVALTVTVSAAPDIPTNLITRALAETDDVWRQAGFTFGWTRAPQTASDGTLHVVIGHATHPSNDGGVALGWIVFEDSKPVEQIYVSYENAVRFLEESQGVVGSIGKMPQLEREVLLSRVLGRALAHEMGHYLLSSKEHTLSGLMQAHRTAAEFFGTDNRQFRLDGHQKSLVAQRLTHCAAAASP